MLMTLPKFDYHSCKSLEEACSILSSHKNVAKVLAGGTDLIPRMKHRKATPKLLVDINRIVPQLNFIDPIDKGGLRIGALATIQAVKNSSSVRKKCSVLYEAASLLGTNQIRNLATLGGNLCNASPAADCSTALLTMDTKVKVFGPDGERFISLKDFFLGPGISALRDGEILTEVHIPPSDRMTSGTYLKHGVRCTDVSVVGVAVTMKMEREICRDIKIVLGAVGPTPLRAMQAEKALIGNKLTDDIMNKASLAASQEALPIDDFRGSADYRKKLVEIQVKEGIKRALLAQKA